ncbi:MAG: SusC/RagA family TonB-linked outer membrane protein [Bacteroidales bacterium]|nr:SusC/RagA family TonB-linked outer membrane protein [Candidatus Cacconaster merdequi]
MKCSHYNFGRGAKMIALCFMFLSLCGSLMAQSGKPAQITGRITDNNGEPVIGATVMIQGTRIGTSTDADGRYSIQAKPSDIINITCIGYSTMQVEVGKRTVINATLLDDVEKLQEIVVTGYQTLSKERSAGSYSTLRGSAIQDKANARGSILESLEGIAPGFQVNMSNSVGTDYKYLVRGVTSIQSNKQPLFVVDGVEISIESLEALLNSDDVQSVTVLKDATAASIWGSQAANGVVVISTKSGNNTNGKYKVKYTGTYTYKGKPDYEYLDMMDSKTFIKNALEVFDPVGYKEASASTGTTGSANFVRNAILFPHEVPMYDFAAGRITEAERDARLAVLAGRDWYSDYSKYMMSDSWLTKHSVSIEGGNNKNQIFSSIAYEGNKGINKNLTNNFKANIREIYNVNKWLKIDFGVNASLATSDYHTPISYGSGRAMTRNTATMSGLPYAALFDESGNPLDHSIYDMNATLKAQAEAALGTNLDYHPLDDFNLSMNKRTNMALRANAGVTIKFFEGFKYEGRFAYNRSNSRYEYYMPQETYLMRYERGISYDKNTKTQYGPATGGAFTATDGYNADWTIRNQLTLDRKFAGKHQVTALAGVEFRENRIESNSSTVMGFDYQTMKGVKYDLTRLQKTMSSAMLSPCMGSLGLMLYGPRSDSFTLNDTKYRYFSMYANAGYTYDNRYTFNGSIRVDQSNLFGSDPSNNFRPIWSVGASWNAKRESFLEDVNWLSKLNVRLSYGLSGNSPKPGYGSPIDIISSSVTEYVDHVAYYISSLAANKIHWEKTATKNIGIDFAFLKHRLYGSVDLYDKHTTDLLDSKELDPTVGTTTVKSNVGELSNKGIEVNIGGSIIRTKDILWDASINFAYNKNKVLSYYHTAYTQPSNLTIAQAVEGYPMGAMFAFKWGGLDHETGVPQIILNDGTLFKGNSTSLSADEVHYQGTSVAPYFGSISTNFKYKGFGVSMMFVYNFGNKIWDDQLTYWYDRLGENIHNDFDKRWRQPGDEEFTTIPSYLYTGKGRTYSYEKTLYMYSDIHVLNGAFIKLRELKLSYDLQQKAVKAMKLSGLSVFAQTNNLFYIAANKEGIDPEYAPYSNGSYRPTKMGPSWTFGLTVNF